MRNRHNRSLRDIAIANNAADRYYAAMYGKEPAFQVPIKPKRAVPVHDSNGAPLERDVLKAVWKFLAHHPKVAWITRMQSGAALMDFGAAGVHPLHFNRKRGMSDLLGQMRDGRIVCCEVKREGADLMPHQREFLNEVLGSNGVAFVARNVADAEEALANA